MIKGDISRNELEDILLGVFEDITSDRNLSNLFEDTLFKNHDIPRTRTGGILSRSIPIQDLLDEELYLITKLSFDNLKDKEGNRINELSPTIYFLPKEISDGENYREVRVINTSKKITFENVQEITYEQYKLYMCVVDLETLADINKRGLYQYDPKTQRQLTKRVLKSGKVVSKPTIITSKVNAIKKTLESSKPNQNVISFNVQPTGSEQFNYDNKSKSLEINIDGVNTNLSIIDSFHRFRAANELYRENPNAKCPFILYIYHMSSDLSRVYISNINLQTPIEDYHVETMKEDNPYMNMTKAINTSGNEETNSLYMRITEDLFDVENGKYYTTFNILSQAIEFNFSEKNKELSIFERRQIQKYLLDAFVYVVGVFENDFKNRKESKSFKIVTEPNAFIGYISILAEIYNNYRDNWEDKIMDVLTSVDFSKSASQDKEWKEIGIYTKNINTIHVKKISNYFRQFVK